jgi:hypothetical protein
MISGASQIDCALLVVDASTGEFEAGFDSGGIVAVNKLDQVTLSATICLVGADKEYCSRSNGRRIVMTRFVIFYDLSLSKVQHQQNHVLSHI